MGESELFNYLYFMDSVPGYCALHKTGRGGICFLLATSATFVLFFLVSLPGFAELLSSFPTAAILNHPRSILFPSLLLIN